MEQRVNQNNGATQALAALATSLEKIAQAQLVAAEAERAKVNMKITAYNQNYTDYSSKWKQLGPDGNQKPRRGY